MNLLPKIMFVICVAASMFCIGKPAHGEPLTRQAFMDAINPADRVSLDNAINKAKFSEFDDDVQAILLDIWRTGRSSVDLKGFNTSDPVLRTSAAGAIFQHLARNPDRSPDLFNETRNYLRKAVDDQDRHVGIQAISNLRVSHDPQDLAKFFEVAKKEDERLRAAVIAFAGNCDPKSIEMAERLPALLSKNNRDFVIELIDRRKKDCRPAESSTSPAEPATPLTRQAFIAAMGSGGPMALNKAINTAKFSGFDVDVQAILLDIWKGKVSADLKGISTLTPQLRTAAAGAIFQSLSRNPGRDPSLLGDTRDYLRRGVDDPNRSVGNEALSNLGLSRDPRDISKFFEVAKMQDERFTTSVIVLTSYCEKQAVELSEELQAELSGEKREHLAKLIDSRKKRCRP